MRRKEEQEGGRREGDETRTKRGRAVKLFLIPRFEYSTSKMLLSLCLKIPRQSLDPMKKTMGTHLRMYVFDYVLVLRFIVYVFVSTLG